MNKNLLKSVTPVLIIILSATTVIASAFADKNNTSNSVTLNENDSKLYDEKEHIANANSDNDELIVTIKASDDVSVKLYLNKVIIEKGIDSMNADNVLFTNVFFRMQNNEIKTYNQLVTPLNGVVRIMDNELPEKKSYYKYEAQFLNSYTLSDIKSIIVDNIEYDINDSSKLSSIKVEAKMYPVKVEALILENQATLLPVKETCDKLGADMSWDGNKLTIEYRDNSIEIMNKSNMYKKNGRNETYQIGNGNVLHIYKDELYITWTALCESLNINAQEAQKPSVDNARNVNGGYTATICTPQYISWYVIP